MAGVLVDLASVAFLSLNGRLLDWLLGGAGKMKLSFSDSGVTSVASEGIAEVLVYSDERSPAVP